MNFITKIKKFFSKKTTIDVNIIKYNSKEDTRLEKIYEDANGNVYYQLKDITQIKYKRVVAAEIATRQAEFCLTKEKLLELIEEMEKCANSGDIVKLFSLLYEIKQRTTMAGEENTLLELAHVYFFMEGENPDKIEPYWKEKKQKAWEADQDAMSFFLQRAYERTVQYQNTSIKDIVTYLRTIKKGNEMLENISQKQSLSL